MKLFLILSFISLSLVARNSFSQSSSEFEQMSLEELLNVRIGIGSRLDTDNTARELPSIVSVITAEEIRKMGHVELSDILSSIPGLDFGSDTQGTVGLAVRGNWAFEGKYLFLIDGEPINESMFGTVPFGNRFPVSLIKRIEIIRGPGSVAYGGTAELAVINVITLGGEDIKGMELHGTYTQMNRTYGVRNGSIAVGGVAGDWKYVGQISAGQGQRSQDSYTDSNGSVWNMRDQSNLNPTFVNLNLQRKELDLRFIVDRYHTTGRDAYGTLAPSVVDNNFDTFYLSGKYQWRLSDTLSILPELHFRKQQPWQSLNEDSKTISGLYYDKTAKRFTAAVTANWIASSWLQNASGVEWYRDSATDNYATFNNGLKSVQYDNTSLYSEFKGNTSLFNFFLGGRMEYSTQYYSSFVPRAGIVKSFDPWNLKLLYSRAFHSPVIENINTNSQIRPEKTGVAELEVGYRASKSLYFSTNVFDIRIDSPIVYNYSNGDAYQNFSSTGTSGAEAHMVWKDKNVTVKANYSFYRPNSKGVSFYQVPGDSSTYLGFAAHKASLSSTIELIKDLSLSSEINFASDRVGYEYDSVQGAMAPHRYASDIKANIFLYKQNLLIPDLNLGIGVNNLTNVNRPFIQPYNGGKPPLPGRSRELVLQANYHLGF